jgi:cupin 2 domain-containing protein
MNMGNIYDNIQAVLTEELFTSIHRTANFRIERIVSQGHCSPEGFWYDQTENEWILLLDGDASIQFDDDPQPTMLRPGDYLNIPAHRKHRVVQTSPTQKTVWLAIFY